MKECVLNMISKYLLFNYCKSKRDLMINLTDTQWR